MTTIDSYRFLDTPTGLMVKSWIGLEQPQAIPWTPLRRPLAKSTVALVSSGGIALKSDLPFDQEIERSDPWHSDAGYRVIPRSATAEDIRVYHLHINPTLAEADINCLLPVERLNALEADGTIGRAAQSHYSFIGYMIDPARFLSESLPAIIQQLQDEHVEVVVLVPA
jgi:D-proline reductase (dithiol) PrdB